MAPIYRRAADACFWLAERFTAAGDWCVRRVVAARRALGRAR